MSATEISEAHRHAGRGSHDRSGEWLAGAHASVCSCAERGSAAGLRCLRHLRVRGSTKTKRHWTCAWRPGAKAPACLVFAALGGRWSIFLALRCPAGNCSAAQVCGSHAPRATRGWYESQPALTRSTWVSGTLYQSRHFPPCRCAARRGPRGFFGRGSLSYHPRVPRGGGFAPQPLPAAGAACGLGSVLRTLLGAPRGWLPPTCSRGLQGLRLDAWPRFAVPQTPDERRAKFGMNDRLHVNLHVQSTGTQGEGVNWARWNCRDADVVS